MKTLLSLATATILIISFKAKSDGPESSCPDLTGHWYYSQIVAKANMNIVQDFCDSTHLEVKADILGKHYEDEVTSPLDGVTRQVGSDSPNVKKYVSAWFHGDIGVFVGEKIETDENGETTSRDKKLIQIVLDGPNKLKMDISDLDENDEVTGTRSLTFKRVGFGEQ